MPIILPSIIKGPSGGDAENALVGTGKGQPGGIESIFEYAGLTLNDRSTIDAYLLTTIDGLHDADIRDQRDVNPSAHGETPFNALYGGRTITLTGKIRAFDVKKLRDMQQALRQAFTSLQEKPLRIQSNFADHDIQINCRKIQPIAMAESHNNFRFERDFMVSLRASNPFFKSVSTTAGAADPVINMLVQPGFEGNFTQWGETHLSSVNLTKVAVGDSPIATSENALLVDTDGAAANEGVLAFLPVFPDEWYTGSIYAKGVNGGEQVILSITEKNSGGGTIGSTSTPITLTSSWQRIAIKKRFTTGSILFLTIANNGTYEQSYYVDNASITRGQLLYPYFDGDTELGAWTGDPNESQSWFYQPSILINEGNYNAYPTFTINGSMDGATITNLATGESLIIDGTIPLGSTYTIDTEKRRIVDHTGASKFYQLSPLSDWPTLLPGSNVIEYHPGQNAHPQSNFSTIFHHTWL